MIKINFKELLKIRYNLDKKEIKKNISSLAPKELTKDDDLEKVKPYLDKLKDTLNVKGINNIALTGGYGSGKSSILKTFQHWNKNEFNFLNISLAAFNKTKETNLNSQDLERQLEISILQQIIYKVKPVNLPESRFKRIVNIPNWKLEGLIPISFTIWFLSVILLFKYNYLDRLNPNTWTFQFKDFDFITILIFLFSFLGIGYFSKLMVELFTNSTINKINLKGEIEIGEKSNNSILNEHYDEILYFFEKNNFNVVVIEDLDRFDNTNIFTKLRELNILLNNADTINNRKCYKDFGIKFLYAIGDDLFNDKKERVKFFEYIIPVIPFINSSNAQEQLMNLIKESELEDNVLSSEFLSDITTFIDDIDMRLLINIFHEFAIYRNVLNPELIKGSEAELFAIITYKNLNPKDYDLLNRNKGKLFELINNKKQYIEDFIRKIEDEIINKGVEIKEIENETINDFRELRSIYANKILSKIPLEAVIQNINFLELDEEEFDKIINNNVEYITYAPYNSTYYTRSTVQNLKYNFAAIEKEINSNYSYNDRIEFIKSKKSNKINLLKREIEALRKKKIEIENWDLKRIFKEISIDHYLIDFTNSGLIRNLLLEGHINENYSDYISLFHEVTLTKEDKKFERSVKSGVNKEFDYKLTQIENLIENKIDLRYFNRESILNFDLINFLGNNYDKYSVKYDAIIDLLSNEKEKSIEFIDRYITIENTQLSIFFEKLVGSWSGFWDYISLKSNYLPEKQDKYLSLIIMYSSLDDILLLQNNNTLTTSIMQKSHFFSLVKNTEELNYYGKITKIIENLNIKFEGLENPNEETKELFDFVFNNNYYQINKINILQMITSYGTNENDFETSNYATILHSNCKPLIDYLNSNINTYIEDVYLKLEQNNYENEVTLLQLLNNEELDEKLKIKIIQKVKTQISVLKNIDDIFIKTQLLINHKVDPSWNNVIHYYEVSENTLNESLINFLEFKDVNTQLSTLKLSKEDKDFERNILTCNYISDETYEKLINSIYYVYPVLEIEKLNEKKVALLTRKILTTSQANYDLLRKRYPNNHITLIEKDFNKFIENIDDFEINEDEIFMILKSDKIIIDNRLKYISKLNEQSISINNKISKKVVEIILTKSSKIKFEYSTLESLVINCDLIENKVKLVNLYIDDLNNPEIISLVKSIGHYYSELFVKQHKPSFNNTTLNKELLTKLLSKELINSFDLDKKDRSKIRAVANY